MIGVKSNYSKTFSQLDKVAKAIDRATKKSLEEVREVTVDAVTDNKHWNPAAVYKGGSEEIVGKKYDLEESGHLMDTIKDKKLNTIEQIESGYVLGIGHIPTLDTLPAKGKQPPGGYWRLVVYGRARIPGWKFVPVEEGGGRRGNKTIGFAVQKDDKFIDSSEPTWMFDMGLVVAERSFANILEKIFGEELSKY